jgi:hypothetical protein
MSVNIQAPSLRAPRVSILSSAETRIIAGERWWGGITTRLLSGDPEQGVVNWDGDISTFDENDIFVLPVCLSPGQEKELFPRSTAKNHVPFVIYATDDCTIQGSQGEDFLDRARQKLTVNEPWAIERMIWDGNAAVTGNFSFVDSTLAPLTTGAHPLAGFALLDSTVAENRHDGRGMIHMTTKVFDLLQQYNLFRREGNVWFSPNDNIVVPGRGYSGNGPSDAAESDTSSWMFGHPGLIEIVHSEIVTIPTELAEGVNISTNDRIVYAERVAAYIFQNDLEGDETDVFSVSVNPTLALGASGSGGGGDASAANQTAGNAILTDIETAVDGLEAVLATQDGRLANLEDSLTADAAALTNVADQDTNIQLLASNANRRGVIIHNDSPGILYVKYGTTASTTSYTYKIAADGTWDMPMPIYTGQIDGIWTSSASGSARITELT